MPISTRPVAIVGFAAAVAMAAALAWGGPMAAEVRRVDAEAISQRQPVLLDRTLTRLQPAGAGPRQLYFVGFAGFGSEAVFKREVVAVRELFDQRFGTRGRSVALINHESTVEEVPLANVDNLERVLRHVGGIMDKSRDTLFLFLTSHGERGVFIVDMPGFDFGQLTPGRLKRLLDGSGIKNRVIVVSSCHSGSFVQPLAAPTTLVIAAARADRTSFGCEDQREWTYFGDAYFNRALREESSFTRAFERAKQTIGQWEAREKLTPSYPQSAGGEALAPTDWAAGQRRDAFN